jgi:hypothetical protein
MQTAIAPPDAGRTKGRKRQTPHTLFFTESMRRFLQKNTGEAHFLLFRKYWYKKQGSMPLYSFLVLSARLP